MIECAMPQDVLKRKSKFIANFSVREVCCAALGIGIGFLCYFSWCKDLESRDLKFLFSALVIIPFFLIGFIKVYDQPFEKLVPTLVLENFIYPLKRRKETHFPEFEKYERTRSWLNSNDMDAVETKNNKNKAPSKIKVVKSETYRGIK